MDKYWAKHPPLHLMVAEFMGIKPESAPSRAAKASEQENTKQDLEEFMQQFSAAGGSVS